MSHGNPELASTTSLCPECLEPVPGSYEARGGAVFLTRSCPDHGTESRKVWGSLDHWEWAADYGPEPGDGAPEPAPLRDAFDDLDGECGPGCGCAPDRGTDAPGDPAAADSGGAPGERPVDTESLAVDNDHACLAVVEVTQDCNLSCSYCFASSGPGGPQLPFEEVVDLLETVKSGGGPRPVQFSGGEPTVRDDLPELVERARGMGFEHVEVNTNGLALARRDGYAERLAEAGVTAIYLQFDGLERGTYEAIREADLLDSKREALSACRRADLPVILVPTVVPGVNDHEMGAIVRFALENLDLVRSVNFQPVAHFGRYEGDDERFSLDEAARLLADQLDGLAARDLLPVPCCSSYCQMATAFLPDGDGGAVPLTRFVDLDGWEDVSGIVDESDWMELLAGTSDAEDAACSAVGCCGMDVPAEGGALLGSVLPVTVTGFMDADAADVERLENCCITVPTQSGDLVPFCAYNMTTDDGEYAVRNRNGWGGRPSVDAPAEPADLRGEGAERDAAGEPDTGGAGHGRPGDAPGRGR